MGTPDLITTVDELGTVDLGRILQRIIRQGGDDSPLSKAQAWLDALARAPERRVPMPFVQRIESDKLFSTRAMAASLEAEKQAKALIVLAGPPGNGKSMAAAHWAIRHGAIWTSEGALETGSWDYLEKVSAIRDPLVVDDVGTVRQNSRGVERAILTIRDRCDRHRLTFVTTNLSRADFERFTGKRLADRLKDAAWVEIDAASLRGQQDEPWTARRSQWAQHVVHADYAASTAVLGGEFDRVALMAHLSRMGVESHERLLELYTVIVDEDSAAHHFQARAAEMVERLKKELRNG